MCFQVSGPNWATYLTGMHANQHGVYENSWIDPDGNPPTLTSTLPPITGRGRPQTLFSVIKEHNQELKVMKLLCSLNCFNFSIGATLALT